MRRFLARQDTAERTSVDGRRVPSRHCACHMVCYDITGCQHCKPVLISESKTPSHSAGRAGVVMENESSYCSHCGSEGDAGAKFCTQCGAPTRSSDAPVEAREVSRPPRMARAQLPVGAARSGFMRFLRVDPSGGLSGIMSPILIWTAAVGILTWSVLGLLSLRFDLSFLNLQDLFFTMLIIVGIILSVAANAFLVLSYRDRTGALGQVLKQLPMVWAAALCVGLSIMIWQVWTDFAGGPNELRRAMFSLIGVGVCGMYGGYLSLVVVGPNRIYQAVRWVLYVSHSYSRLGNPGCAMVGDSRLVRGRDWDALPQSRWNRICLRCRVLLHCLLHGSSKIQEAADQRAHCVPRAGAVRFYDCGCVIVGHFSCRCNPIRPRRNRHGDHRDYWTVARAAIP